MFRTRCRGVIDLTPQYTTYQTNVSNISQIIQEFLRPTPPHNSFFEVRIQRLRFLISIPFALWDQPYFRRIQALTLSHTSQIIRVHFKGIIAGVKKVTPLLPETAVFEVSSRISQRQTYIFYLPIKHLLFLLSFYYNLNI